jgi:hypothetical protein
MVDERNEAGDESFGEPLDEVVLAWLAVLHEKAAALEIYERHRLLLDEHEDERGRALLREIVAVDARHVQKLKEHLARHFSGHESMRRAETVGGFDEPYLRQRDASGITSEHGKKLH